MFDDLKAFVMFVGYPRSGHSVVSALLDAHPRIVISHELDALTLLEQGVDRTALFYHIIRRSQRWDRRQSGYRYWVPELYQGEWEKLEAIGDKRGGVTAQLLAAKPELLDRLRETVRLPLKIIHVVRHPLDTIATIFRCGRRHYPEIDDAVGVYPEFIVGVGVARRQTAPEDFATVYHEDLLADPKALLEKLCEFLGQEAEPEVFGQGRQDRLGQAPSLAGAGGVDAHRSRAGAPNWSGKRITCGATSSRPRTGSSCRWAKAERRCRERRSRVMQKLILRCHRSPGNVVMLTAAVRELHQAHPGRFVTDVRGTARALWDHNRHITPLEEDDPAVEIIDMEYPLINRSNQRPYHFIHGYTQYLESRLGVPIPVTRFRGDIHLAPWERERPALLAERGLEGDYWIIVAGGKYDFTAKWWDPAAYQQVVSHFAGRIQFVQCGASGHWHPPLEGAINLVGRTDVREFVGLMHHADGVVCPVTLAMHLAAAVETRRRKPAERACVVIAGGREPPHWEAYPQHQFIGTVGMLHCCAGGGCWKSRCQPVGDNDEKDYRNRCQLPVLIGDDLRIPRCMHMITPQMSFGGSRCTTREAF